VAEGERGNLLKKTIVRMQRGFQTLKNTAAKERRLRDSGRGGGDHGDRWKRRRIFIWILKGSVFQESLKTWLEGKMWEDSINLGGGTEVCAEACIRNLEKRRSGKGGMGWKDRFA